MSRDKKYGLRELKNQFPDDDACLDYLFTTLHTRECSCGGVYHRIEGRKQYQCSKCRFQIAPMAGTIFEKSTTPLTLWFQVILMFSNAKSGLSAKMVERQLNVTYKCAWRMLKLIRESLKQNNRRLKGEVEMDEGYIGGRHFGGKNNELLSVAMSKKAVVMGAVERGGEIRAKVTPDASANTAWGFINENIDKENTRLLTDKSNRYNSATVRMKRESVDHGHKEFVRGDVHVNNIESFWAHLKRSIKGTHKSISKKYLQTYLDAFVWHRNNRHNDRERFASLLGALLPA